MRVNLLQTECLLTCRSSGDVKDFGSISVAVEAAVLTGGIEVLLLSHGVQRSIRFEDVSIEDIDHYFEGQYFHYQGCPSPHKSQRRSSSIYIPNLVPSWSGANSISSNASSPKSFMIGIQVLCRYGQFNLNMALVDASSLRSMAAVI